MFRSYLIQRAKLLRIYRKRVRKNNHLPHKIYRELGVPVACPALECGDDPAHVEYWRLIGVNLKSRDCSTSTSCESLDSQLVRNPSYNLSLNCRWVSDNVGSTVGVRPVRRVIKQLSTLIRWKKYRDARFRPRTDLEKCISLYNTVDLEVIK